MKFKICLQIFAFFLLFFPQICSYLLINGTHKVHYKPPADKQCSSNENSEKNVGLHFSVEGKGYCDVLICYPSQFEANFAENGTNKVKSAFQMDNLNPINCPNGWHSILARANSPENPIELSLSYANLTKNVSNNAVLDLDMDKEDQYAKDYIADRKLGAVLSDFAGFWAFGLDMLPPTEGDIQLNVKHNHTENELVPVCDVEKGYNVPGRCKIRVKLVGPSIVGKASRSKSGNNEDQEQVIKLPFKMKLDRMPTAGTNITIRGRPSAIKGESDMRIYLLHGWEEDGDHEIMGERILYVKVRNDYLNVFSYKAYRQEGVTNDGVIEKYEVGIGLDSSHGFVLNITVQNDGYGILLNCKERGKLFQQKTTLLPYTSIEHIYIDGSMDLLQEPNVDNSKAESFDPAKSPISKSKQIERNLGPTTWLKITARLLDSPKAFTINLVHRETPSSTDKSAVLTRFKFEQTTQNFTFEEKPPNTIKWFKNENLIKSGEVFTWIYIPGNGIFLNNHHLFGVNGLIKSEKINYIQLKGDLLDDVNVEQIPGGDTKLRLSQPFRTFTALEIRGIPSFKDEDEFIRLKFSCLNENRCIKQSGLTKLENANFSMDLYQKVWVYMFMVNSEFGQIVFNSSLHNVTIQSGIPFTLKLHASPYEYILYLNNVTIGELPYTVIPSPEHLDTITMINDPMKFIMTEPHQIEWDQQNFELELPFSYMLEKPLEIGSKISLKIIFKKGKDKEMFENFNIYLLHQAPHYTDRPKIGNSILHMQIHSLLSMSINNESNLHYQWDVDSFTNAQNISRKIYKFSCEIFVQKNEFVIQVGGKHLLDHKYGKLPAWSVQFVSIDGSVDDLELEYFRVTWPSDSAENWLLPPDSLMPKNSYPINMLGYSEIELVGELKENVTEIEIYFLNNCAEFVEGICDVILSLKLNSTSNATKGDLSKFTLKIKHMGYVEMENDREMVFSSWAIGADSNGTNITITTIPLENANYVWVSEDTAKLEKPIIKYSANQTSRIIRLERPLRVGDHVEIKGRIVEENLIRFEIGFLHGLAVIYAPNDETSDVTMLMDIDTNLDGNVIGFYYYVKRGPMKPADWDETKVHWIDIPATIKEKLEFHYRIDVQQKHFEISTAEESGEKLEHLYNYTYAQKDGTVYLPYWAVQFIRVISKVELDEGYPKIVQGNSNKK